MSIKQHGKKLGAILLTLVMLLALMPWSAMPVRAATFEYDLWVGGTQVTSGNTGDIVGNGTASYNYDTRTLTLKNYVYEGEGYSFTENGESCAGAIYYSGSDTLNIVLNGENCVTQKSGTAPVSSYGIRTKSADLVISGNGTLTAKGGDASSTSFGVNCGGSMTVTTGAAVKAYGGNAGSFSFGVNCGNAAVTGGAALEAYGGDKGSYSHGIILTGTIVIDESSSFTAAGNGSAIQNGGVKNAAEGKISTSADGTESFAIIEKCTSEEGQTISDMCKYVEFPAVLGLWVGGVDIAKAENKTVSGSSGTATLTYDTEDNPVLTLDNYVCKGEGLSFKSVRNNCASAIYYADNKPLTIELVGTSSVTQEGGKPGSSYGIYVENYSESSVTFTGTGTLTAQGGEAEQDSIGIYCYNYIALDDSSNVTAKGGAARVSCGVMSGYVKLKSGCALGAEGGAASGEGAMSCGVRSFSYGVGIGGDASGKGSTLTAKGGAATGKGAMSCGVYGNAVFDSGVDVIYLVTLTAEGGEATGEDAMSCGVYGKGFSTGGDCCGVYVQNGAAVEADGDSYGVYGEASGKSGVYGVKVGGSGSSLAAAGGSSGIYGTASGTEYVFGVNAYCGSTLTATGTDYGIYSAVSGGSNVYDVYFSGAGLFDGDDANVVVSGGAAAFGGEDGCTGALYFGPVGRGFSEADGTGEKTPFDKDSSHTFSELSGCKYLRFPAVKAYSLWVGGTQVTSDNADNITTTVGTSSGKASYDPDKHILTLEDYKFNGAACVENDTPLGSVTTFAAIFWSGDKALTIELKGESNVTETITEGDYGYGIYSKTILAFTGTGSLSVAGKGGTDCNYGVYLINNGDSGNLSVTGGAKLTAAGGDAGNSSCGVKCYGLSADGAESALTAEGGKAGGYSCGVKCGGGIAVSNGATVEGTGGASDERSIGICQDGPNSLSVTAGAKLTGTGGAAGSESNGICSSAQNEVTVTGEGSELNGTAGAVVNSDDIGKSCGVLFNYCNPVIGKGATVTAKGGSVTANANGAFSYGFTCLGNLTVSSGASLTAEAGNVSADSGIPSIGIACGFKGDVTLDLIVEDGAVLSAKGSTQAVLGKVKNSGLGSGCKETGETGTWEEIPPCDEEGQELNDYKNVKLLTLTLTLDANDGSTAPGTIKTVWNIAAKLLDDTFTRDGYSFAGWNTKADGSGTEYTGTAAITEDTTLYAQWTRNTYAVTVTAGANMARKTDSGAESQSVNTGESMTAVIYTANDGYYFPTDYSVEAVNGVSVTRDSFTQITVSGTPTAAAAITLTGATQKTKEATPDASFTAEGADIGTLSGVTAGMKYKIGTGEWVDITGTSVTLTRLSACTIKVCMPGNGTTTADSDEQSITVTKAAAPTGVGKTDCTVSANNNGSLTGVTDKMEYIKRYGATLDWTSGTGEDITGLEAGTYYVRVKATGTTLASDVLTLTIAPCAGPSVDGEFKDGKLVATVTAPDGGTLIAAVYDANGAFVKVSSTPVDEGSTALAVDTKLAQTDGYTYKLMLVGKDYVPLCAAWDSSRK